MFALFDVLTNQIIRGPWRQLPGRLEWPDTNSQISPTHVGAQHGNYLVVEVIDQDVTPTRFHEQTSQSQQRNGAQLSISRSFAQTGVPSAHEIKAEARRRILEAYPDWKQANMTARAVELQDIWRRNGAWSAQEQAQAAVIQSAWDWIKSIRAKSDALEGMPVLDFEDNSHWQVS